jgi:hypothetical protein
VEKMEFIKAWMKRIEFTCGALGGGPYSVVRAANKNNQKLCALRENLAADLSGNYYE